ncbi:MAG: PD-(D/E)XK nuclease family protein, partial [Vicinamibacterales bacterium]
FSIMQFAARTALLTLARRGRTPSTSLVSEAVATRAAFDAAQAAALEYFAPVAGTPGFPRALARTLTELRGASVTTDALEVLPLVGPDLARLLEHFERAIADAHASDRAELLNVAALCLTRTRPGGTFVLLDVTPGDVAERRLFDAILNAADTVVATVAPGDQAEAVFVARGDTVQRVVDEDVSDLPRLRRYLFDTDAQPSRRSRDGSLEIFSAPGEGRECVEIVRRVLREARRGVRFDEMAILVRSPQSYFGLLEHAMARAGIPVWFDRGTRRPHPAGRAFLALLACATDRISAVRFAEYLSLSQVPTTAPVEAAWEEPVDEVTWRALEREADELEVEDRDAAREPVDLRAPIVAGTLRAPWRWESLIVDARIIGGGADRWRRRFDGHRQELERRLRDVVREEGGAETDSAAGQALRATLGQLDHLCAFALPIVDILDGWSGPVVWGEWLDRFIALAPRVLRRPAYVLRVLGELRPMATVGPVTLDEARRVLAQRLLTVEAEAPSRRYGRVFVGTPQQVRGRAFRTVFVPGLAERLFPQKPREDPLLLDALRATLSGSLSTESERLLDERQLLRLAVGAAVEHLCVSYPRLEVSEARARVPSFYALDLLRAVTGEVPDHEALEQQAREAGGAMLAWPAPDDPGVAIDEMEHDLAVVRRLLDHPAHGEVRGHAHYLLTLSETLRRSVIERWRRARGDWSPYDGLTRVTASTTDALASQRLTARPYSLSALQRFASCPYQFVLSSLLRLQPLDEPAPLERIDPLTRGSLIHEVQARVMRDCRDRRLLPITAETHPLISRHLDDVIDDVTTRAREALAPAVDRVWSDDVASMRRDMHGWLARMATESDWVPAYFEFAFGRVPGERDPASAPEPVVLDGGYILRGAIDLIEVHATTGELRVTDYKTGRAPDKLHQLMIGGGAVLQ